jgi:hypothetical protein
MTDLYAMVIDQTAQDVRKHGLHPRGTTPEEYAIHVINTMKNADLLLAISNALAALERKPA